MLFNDEVHTYEQVIYTLQKAVNCSQKEAVSFATTVDRDVSIVTDIISSKVKVMLCGNVDHNVCWHRAGSRCAMEISSFVNRPSL